MTIMEAIKSLMRLAERSNMTLEELLEWISRNDREGKNTPWEE